VELSRRLEIAIRETRPPGSAETNSPCSSQGWRIVEPRTSSPQADAAMYEAKRSGDGYVVVGGVEEPYQGVGVA